VDRVLNICHACIHSKQTKNDAGCNTTRTAEQPYQCLSINFSFSGTQSKNTFNRFPIGTKVKKKFSNKVFKEKVVRNLEDTTECDPDANDFGKTTQSWRVEYEDQEQEDCNAREMEWIAYGNPPRFNPHKHRDDDHLVFNGETSWILITDHFSRMKMGIQEHPRHPQSIGSGNSWKSMLQPAQASVSSWTKAMNCTVTIQKCASSLHGLDMRSDQLALMPPTKMLQLSAAT